MESHFTSFSMISSFFQLTNILQEMVDDQLDLQATLEVFFVAL